MDLSNLKAPAGANRPTKRLGRGPGSGTGKTAGKGHKGKKARSGKKVSAGFEGGQTPLHRRVPKFGFTNPFTKHYTIINLTELERLFENGDVVDEAVCREKRLVRRNLDGIKILGSGELTKKLTIKANKFSKSAVEAIEKAGGSAEVIERVQ